MENTRKARTPDELHVKAAENGGFIVRHSFDNSMSGESYQPPKEHAFSSARQAHSHVKEHMLRMAGVQSGGDEIAEAAASKGKKDAKKAAKLGKDGGAEAGTGSPRKIKKAPGKTSYGGTKPLATQAAGKSAARLREPRPVTH